MGLLCLAASGRLLCSWAVFRAFVGCRRTVSVMAAGGLLPSHGLSSSDVLADTFAGLFASADFGVALRGVLDRAIDSARTDRFCVEELQKSEKTAVGTQVEIAVRDVFGLSSGDVLDVEVDGVDVDVKWSTGVGGLPGSAWMIPTETFGHHVLLLTAWETAVGSFFSAGVLHVAADGSNLGAPNKDRKRGVPKATRDRQVRWVLDSFPMPGNFLLSLSDDARCRVLGAPAGPERIAAALSVSSVPLSDYQVALLDVPNPVSRLVEVQGLLSGSGAVPFRDVNGFWSVR